MGKNVWVSPKDGKWSVKQEGNKKSSGIFSTKVKAEEYGRKIAKANHSELISQKRDGKIGSKDSFGNDSCPHRDTEH